jgi:hypothetical protein
MGSISITELVVFALLAVSLWGLGRIVGTATGKEKDDSS